MEAIGIAFLVGFFIWAIVHSQNEKKKRLATIATLAKQLNGTATELAVKGEIAGTDVELRYTTRGSGKSRTSWTEVDAEFPDKYPLAFFLQKHGWGDASKIASGDMVDVIVGDAAFDRAFRVEAAPADVARVLLHDRARSYLLQLADKLWFEITTVRAAGAKPVLRLAIRSWLLEVTDAMAAIETIASIASRVRDAYSAVELAAEQTEESSPYRPMLDDRRARDAAEARLAEVKKVETIVVERAARQQMVAIAIIIGIVLLAILATAAK